VGGSMRTAIQYTLKPPPAGSVGALYRPHTCHRLDKPTSGLLLCAKTKPDGSVFEFRRQVYKALTCYETYRYGPPPQSTVANPRSLFIRDDRLPAGPEDNADTASNANSDSTRAGGAGTASVGDGEAEVDNASVS